MRWSKQFLVADFTLLIIASFACSTAVAQERLTSTTQDSALLDAPQRAQVTSRSVASDSQQRDTGTITGTVLDKNRDVLQGARVTVSGPSGSAIRTVESGSDGQFAFTGLPPATYKLTVTAPGMSTFTSDQIPLHTGKFRILPPVILSLSTVSTTVTVTSNKEQLTEEQVQIAIHRRIGGVIPNF